MDFENVEVGIVLFEDAFRQAEDEGFDLVEIAASAVPPVVRIMNYGKFIYEQTKREKEQRKKQLGKELKELKFHVNIHDHDYQTKVKHALEFIEHGNKVKLTLQFRSREVTHPELGDALVKRVIEDLKAVALIETPAKLLGRNMSMVFAPRRHN